MIKNETVMVTYCDICGKKVEKHIFGPFTITNYRYRVGDSIRDRQEQLSPCIDLCSYHSGIVGHLMVDAVKKALSFIHSETKLKEIIKREEITRNKRS